MTINCLSLSSINEKAPYHVWSANGISFSFQTETDVVYGVSFVEDHMISDDGDVMQLIISVNEGEASQKDIKIQLTVSVIIWLFSGAKIIPCFPSSSTLSSNFSNRYPERSPICQQYDKLIEPPRA